MWKKRMSWVVVECQRRFNSVFRPQFYWKTMLVFYSFDFRSCTMLAFSLDINVSWYMYVSSKWPHFWGVFCLSEFSATRIPNISSCHFYLWKNIMLRNFSSKIEETLLCLLQSKFKVFALTGKNIFSKKSHRSTKLHVQSLVGFRCVFLEMIKISKLHSFQSFW
jgi:hypothetical protein